GAEGLEAEEHRAAQERLAAERLPDLVVDCEQERHKRQGDDAAVDAEVIDPRIAVTRHAMLRRPERQVAQPPAQVARAIAGAPQAPERSAPEGDIQKRGDQHGQERVDGPADPLDTPEDEPVWSIRAEPGGARGPGARRP